MDAIPGLAATGCSRRSLAVTGSPLVIPRDITSAAIGVVHGADTAAVMPASGIKGAIRDATRLLEATGGRHDTALRPRITIEAAIAGSDRKVAHRGLTTGGLGRKTAPDPITA